MSDWRIVHVNHKSSDAEKREVTKFWTGSYIWMTESRLSAPWDDETYGIAAAFIGRRCISTTSYTISKHGIGVLSQVHTDDEFRKKGIGGKIINEALATFRKNGGKAVYLASWAQWIRDIYLGRGFVNVGNMGQRGAFKLEISEAGSDDALFKSGQQTTFRPMSAGDQTDITSLFCAQHPYVVKNYELGCYLGSYFEGEFYILRNQVVEGIIPEERKDKEGFRAIVLEGEETILGLGTVIPSSRRHEGKTAIVDFLVHQNYRDKMPEMLYNLCKDSELDHLTAYIEVNENDKRELLDAAGFKKLTTLERQLDIAGEVFDLEMWRK